MSEHVIWNELGILHYNAGAYDQAIKAYNQAVELEGEFGLALHNLALAHTKKGNLGEAVPLYKKSLDLIDNQSDKALSWKHLGDAYRQLHERQNALEAYQKAVDLAPENAAFKSEMAVLLQELLQSGEEQTQPVETESVSPTNADHAVDYADWGAEMASHEPSPASTLDEGSASLSPEMDSDAIQLEFETHPENEALIIAAPADASALALDSDDAIGEPEVEVALSSQPGLTSQMAGYFMEVFIEQIYPNPQQPRTTIDASDLVDSIREYGIIQPLIVASSESPNRYTLISGERRLEAARQVGLDVVPVFVREVNPQQLLELALIENVNRSNLSPLEQAKALARLRDEFNLSQEDLAAHTGKSRVAVANSIRLARLPENLMRALDSRRITEGHAQALLALPTMDSQIAVLQQILDGDLTIRQTEALVRIHIMELRSAEKMVEDHQIEEAVIIPIENEPAMQEQSDEETNIQAENNVDIESAFEATSDEKTNVQAENNVDIESAIEATSEAENVDVVQGEGEVEGEVEVEPELEATETETIVKTISEPESVAEELSELPTIQVSSPKETPEPEPPSLDHIRNSSITYKKVTEMNPENDKAWEMLGSLYISLGEFDNAISAYQRAAAINPGNENYHYRLGQVYVFQKNYENAVRKFEQTLELNPENIYARCALAGSLRHQGLDDDALQHLEIAAPQIQNEKVYNRACFESICGNADGAVELLKQALEKGQTSLKQLRSDPDLEFIQNDPGFIALIEGEAIAV